MGESTGSSDEAIGRPKEWREGRYQQPNKKVDDSVGGGPAAEKPADTVSTPVTRQDYEQVAPPRAPTDDDKSSAGRENPRTGP